MPNTAEAAVPLSLHLSVHPEAAVLHCAGTLTNETAALLKTQVKGALRETKRVTLDLTNLSRIDSAGLGTIVGLYISARSAGRQFEIINLSPRVRELFSVTKLLSVFEACGSAGTRMP